ncbi:MAG: hypothetical protein RSE41_04970 [Clostridia bacterium]
MSIAFFFNIIIMIVILFIVVLFIKAKIKNSNNKDIHVELERDKEKYSIDTMQSYIKKQFDEITRMNLYDLALSEEEFERRKNIKYELKKALKGAGYADISDKKYVMQISYT